MELHIPLPAELPEYWWIAPSVVAWYVVAFFVIRAQKFDGNAISPDGEVVARFFLWLGSPLVAVFAVALLTVIGPFVLISWGLTPKEVWAKAGQAPKQKPEEPKDKTSGNGKIVFPSKSS